MRITQSQPTVSSTLAHHVARGSVVLRPNIKSISEHSVQFDDGRSTSADVLVSATGYKISFPFLSPEVARQVMPDPSANEISLYQNVFHPRHVLPQLQQPCLASSPPHFSASAHPSPSSASYSRRQAGCCPWLRCSADGPAKFLPGACRFRLPPS
jgi:hypothetical protein